VLADIERVLGGQLADMTFCDPPYNVDYANSPKDRLRGKHRPILNDDLGGGFEAFLYDACVNILSVTKGAVYVCMSSSELDTLQRAFRAAGGKWSTFVIWAKNTFKLAVEGPGGVQASFDFRGAKNDVAGRMLTVTLTNDLDGTVYG
jgi:DNA modification methylase